MFKEGADWPPAARAIDLVPSGSDQDRLQRFGRLTRDYPGKVEVRYFSFFPRIVDGTAESQRKQLTSLFAHFHARLVLMQAVSPIKVGAAATSDGDGTPTEPPANLLGDYLAQEQEAMLRLCCEALIRLADAKERVAEKVTASEAERVIVGTLKQHFQVTQVHALAAQIAAILKRGKPSISGDANMLVQAGSDRVWSQDVLNGLTVFSGGIGGPTTFEAIRQAMDSAFETAWWANYKLMSLMNLPPPSNTSEYWWVTHNKTLRTQGLLGDDKVKALETIGWWVWTVGFADRWTDRHRQLASLSAQPPAGTLEYNWVRQQRRMFAQGTLPDERAKLCEAIPWWRWNTNSDNWAAQFQRIASLPSPPRASSKAYVKDAETVRYWRKQFASGRLSAERIRQLESIPWWKW